MIQTKGTPSIEPMNERDDRVRPRVVLKLNNCVSNDPCALCGTRTDPRGGLDYMLAGTWALVCDTCAEKRAPGLRLLVGRAQLQDETDPVTRMVAYGAEYGEADLDGLYGIAAPEPR